MSDPLTPTGIAARITPQPKASDDDYTIVGNADLRAALALLDAQAAEIARLEAERKREDEWRRQAIRTVRAIATEDAARTCDKCAIQHQVSNRVERAETAADCAAAIRALTPAPEATS